MLEQENVVVGSGCEVCGEFLLVYRELIQKVSGK